MSLRNASKSANRTPLMCLTLKKGSGQKPELWWETDGASHGAYSTRNSGESPSVVVESRLSQILVDNAPEKYFLTAEACQGVLNRAELRGKSIPPELEAALVHQAQVLSETPVKDVGMLSHSKDEAQKWERSETANTYDMEEQRADELVLCNPPKSNVICFNAWDSQSGRIYSTDGVYHSLTAAEKAGMQRDAIYVAGFSFGQSAKAHSLGFQEEIAPTLRGGSGGNQKPCVLEKFADYGFVRRLMPIECERLQGFPDEYTDIGDYIDNRGRKRKTSDSARYRALGNSIALPPWRWVLNRISKQFDHTPMMGSLFDGIGGFSLLWTEINGKGTVLWGSEIDPFCNAVTKMRIE